MNQIDNKFNIGDKAWTTIRIPYTKNYKCPACNGTGKLQLNDYEIPCKQCCGKGSLESVVAYILTPVEVTIYRIIASIWKDHTTVKYKFLHQSIKNRTEQSLFHTKEEAEDYCKKCNMKEIPAEF